MNRGGQHAVNGAGAAGEDQEIQAVKENVEDGNARDGFGSKGIIDAADVAPQFDAQRATHHDDGYCVQLARGGDGQESRGQHQEQGYLKVTLHADVRLPLLGVSRGGLCFCAHRRV